MRASASGVSARAIACAALLSLLAPATFSVAATPDGTWRPLPLVPGRDQALAHDDARHRLLLFGGSDGSAPHNDVWVFDLSGATPGWRLLETAGTPPSARQGAAAFYDPNGDRLLVFGGQDRHSVVHDVWQLVLAGTPTWSEIHPSGSPPFDAYMRSAAFDPIGDRLLVFGGYYGFARNDAWVLTLRGEPAWKKLGSLYVAPGGRAGAIAVFDPRRGRFVVTGGNSSGDAWALELDPSPVSPSTRPDRHGASRAGLPKNETPVPAGGRWVQIASSGPDGLHPSGVADPTRDRLVAVVGTNTTQAWTLDYATGTWSPLPDGAGGFGASGGLAFDPVGDRVLTVAANPVDDVWQLDFAPGAGWSRVAESDATPSLRFGAAIVLDAPGDRVVLFGGRGAWLNRIHRETPVYSDVLELPLDGRWRELATGNGPSARWATAAIFDPVRERMIVFGGSLDGDAGPAVNEVWSLSLAGPTTWQLLSPAGKPPAPRWGSAAAYDPVRDRMIIQGGTDGVTAFADGWSLALDGSPQWSPLTPSGAPPPALLYPTIVYDPVSDRMILFGAVGEFAPTTELWALDLAGTPAWAPLGAAGTPPPSRTGHGAVYDPARDRLLVYGGRLADHAYYELTLRPTPVWRTPDPAGVAPESRAFAGVVLDARRNRLLAIAGRGPCYLTSDCAYSWVALADAWQLQFDPPTPLAIPPVPAAAPRADLRLETPRPNPSTVPTVSFALADGSPARLEVFDLGGRRMLVRELGAPGAGSHVVRLSEARGLGPGVYLMRLTQAERSASARMVVMK